MEVKEKSKKRELIKSIAIVFLAVLLVLTFFSNTIMNRSLPEVATQMVQSGTINAKIRGSGTVSANESYEVILDQTREIRSVCVKVGDTVSQGDLLFVLADAESQELKDAQDQLQTLQLDYQKQILNLSKEYSQSDLSVQILQEDLQKAIAQRDANRVSETDVSYAKGDLAAAQMEKSQIELVLEELNDLMSENEAYQEAQAAVTQWTAKVDTAQAKVDTLEEKLAEAGSSGSVDSLEKDVADAKEAMNQAEAAMGEASTALNSVMDQYADLYREIENAAKRQMIADGVDITDESKLSTYMDYVVQQDPGKYGTAYKAIGDAQSAYDDAAADFAAKSEAYQTLYKLLVDAAGDTDLISTLREQLSDAEDELSTAKRNLRDAEDDLEDAEDENSDLKAQINRYKTAQREVDTHITTLEDNLKALEDRQSQYESALETIASKERELEQALSGKDIDKQLDNLDLQATRLQIEKQQELVDKYRTETIATEVTANVSGVISSINVSAGKDNTPGEAMAVIDVVDRGYTIKIAVTIDQAKQVKIGDSADVTNYYWGNDIQAKLEAITADPAKPGQGKLLVFRITGDIDAGSSISLSVGQRSANYDTIIPKSALRSDTNGDFVLVITAKSTPLGNRYIATRADVQILSSDDNNAAVTGLASGDYVITTSSKPLDAGMQVRMVENP